MCLRPQRRTIGGETYEYWTLVGSRRTATGPRQHTVETLGKVPGLDRKVCAGWESIDPLLEGRRPAPQLSFNAQAQADEPLWREVNVRGVRVERMREFGGKSTWLSRCGGDWVCTACCAS